MAETQETNVYKNVHTTAAGVLKEIIAVVGIVAEAYSDISSSRSSPGQSGAGSETGNLGAGICSGVCTILNFGLSFAVGFYLYSPMDVHDNSSYSKDIQRISNLSSAFTYLWWIKSITSLARSGTAILDGAIFKGNKKAVAAACNYLFMFECSVSALVEGAAVVEACIVTDKHTGDEKKDGGCFISDTLGYVFDDVHSILDVVYDANSAKAVMVCRGICGGAFCASQIATGAVLFTV